MLIEQQHAYVLHSRPYRETSLLVECLTRDYGRLGVIARGVRQARAKAQLQRAQLEPFQSLSLDLFMRGELANLRHVERQGRLLRLFGATSLAGLYANELVMRLTARQDPQPELFAAYEQMLWRLSATDALAWPLRRFERDLLAALGYALQLEYEASSGEPLEPATSYRYAVGEGPRRCRPDDAQAVSGSDLLALAADHSPSEAGLRGLRRMMRQIIRFHLGGGELHAWQLLSATLSYR